MSRLRPRFTRFHHSLALAVSLVVTVGGFAADSGPQLVSISAGGSAWVTIAQLTEAADLGNPKACAQLGEMLVRGTTKDLPRDPKRGLALLEQAARAGDAAAAFRLGMVLEEGDAAEQDWPRAFAYLRAAAVGGVDEAFRNVGVAYSKGRGVKRDYAEALAWFILAQNHDTADSLVEDLRAHLTRLHRPELIAAAERRVPELERELAKTTVAQSLPPPAPFVVTNQAPVKLAAVIVGKNAGGRAVAPAAGSTAPSEPLVKLIAPTGRVLTWPNLDALQRAADQGDTDALTGLGQILLDGKLLSEDSLRAAAVLERAAQAGSADAAQHLAELYSKGTRINGDDTKAFAYTLQAAKGGVYTAAFNLGALYANGRGTPANYPEALAWMLVAQHYHRDPGSLPRIRDYVTSTQPAEVPLAEKRAAARIKEIDAIRDALPGL